MKPALRYLLIMPAKFQRSPAVLRAMALAKRSSAELLLASFEYDKALDRASSQGFDLPAYIAGRGQKLEEFAAGLRNEGFKITTRIVWGQPLLPSMLREVLKERPKLVLKDVHAEPALQRLLFTTQDLELLRLCPAPLMLVRPGTGVLPQEIVAAVEPLDEDGRPHELNEQILKAAEEYGMQSGAGVDVVHAMQFVPLPADPSALSAWVPDPMLQQELRKLHENMLNELGARYGVEERHLHMLDGNPADAIAEFAAKYRAGLVIMGTVYRSATERFFIGSVAEGLLDRLHCDLLALKPSGFAAALTEHLDKRTRKAA